MKAGEIEETPVGFLAGEHIVDLGDDLFAFLRRLFLVCALQILHGLIGVAVMEGFDVRELLVEFTQGIASGDVLDLSAPCAVSVFIDVY